MTDLAMPWLHPTIAALAQALGVTDRSLELWRRQGAPLPATGPFDELALRLWHRCVGPGRRPSKRTAALLPPTVSPLTTYDALLQDMPTTRRAGEDPDAVLKRARARQIALRTATQERAYLTAARSAASAYLSAVRGQIDRASAALAARLVAEIGRGSPAEAETRCRLALRAALDAAETAAIGPGVTA